MTKYLCTVILLITCFFAIPSNGRAETRSSNATLITLEANSVSEEETTHDTSHFLYLVNDKGDTLSVYKSDEDTISEAIEYRLVSTKDGNAVVMHAIHGDAESDEKLPVRFNDSDHSVTVNKADRYVLYPEYYARLKTDVQQKRLVISLLNLLQDRLGDYSFNNLSPLLLFAGQEQNKTIQQASIVTQRSQAEDVADKWNAHFTYDKNGTLTSVKEESGKDIRFKKTINYKGSKINTIETYRNLEDRQITESKITYKNDLPFKAENHIEEAGKNRETAISIVYKVKKLATIESTNITQDVLSKLINTR